MSRTWLRLWLCVCVLLALPTAASAARPQPLDPSAIDRLLFSDESLAALDYRLNALYSVAVHLTPSATALRQNQKAWLKNVRAQCPDVPCLTAVYQQRNDYLMQRVQKGAHPLPPTFNAEIEYPATQSPYCRINEATKRDVGHWFAINATITETAVTGAIDLSYDCGRKLIDQEPFKGKRLGHVALVEFQSGWDENRGQIAQALIVATPQRIYWRVLTKITVESYIFTAEDMRLKRPTR